MKLEPIDKILETIPTDKLLRAAKERNQELRQKYGKYGAQKKIVKCEKCKKEGGVREMRRHKCVNPSS